MPLSRLKTIIVGRPNGYRRRALGIVIETLSSSEYVGDQPAHKTEHTPDIRPSEEPVEEMDSGVSIGGVNKLEPPRSVTPPDGYEVVLHKDSLAVGEMTEVIGAGTAIVVARTESGYYALSNICKRHSLCPLSEGELVGETIVCPYHGWVYDVKTGDCETNPEGSVQTFKVLIEQDAVCVLF